MKSAIDIVDIVYGHLNVTELTSLITGSVYKLRRTLNSKKIDVVISTLANNNEQLEKGIVNVNIHVPNVSVDTDGLTDDLLPDLVTLRSLTALVIGLLNDKYIDDYSLEVQQDNIFPEDERKEHYSNIRIVFYYINL